MNAAARLVHQNVSSRHLVLTYLLSRSQMMMLLLALAVLFSATSIIYATHSTRVLYSSYQRYLVEQDRLHIERSKLLLERSTLLVQARVQHIAEEKLGMLIPNNKSVVIIHE